MVGVVIPRCSQMPGPSHRVVGWHKGIASTDAGGPPATQVQPGEDTGGLGVVVGQARHGATLPSPNPLLPSPTAVYRLLTLPRGGAGNRARPQSTLLARPDLPRHLRPAPRQILPARCVCSFHWARVARSRQPPCHWPTTSATTCRTPRMPSAFRMTWVPEPPAPEPPKQLTQQMQW